MTWYIWLAVALVSGTFLTLWSFVATMHIMHIMRREDVTLFWKVTLAPLALAGLILDWVLFNWIFGTIMFREIPQEFLFSSRVERHFRKSDGRDLRVAEWWARQLNQIDSGHIKRR